MYNPEFVLKNETYKLLGDFQIQTDHLISELVIINKKKRTCRIVDFAVQAEEDEKKDKYLDLDWELKKTVEHDGDSDHNCN